MSTGLKVAVIGGGASGLATLKFLLHAHEYFPIPPIDAHLFEADNEIGGTFVRRVYEDGELVSSKYLTAFSDFRLPRDAADFITPATYVQYLKDYATRFGLWDAINLSARVESVHYLGKPGRRHVVLVQNAGGRVEWFVDAVAVCSGLNVNPRIPKIEGIDKVPMVLHSSRLKTREQFGKDTNVVVLGAGETAMDIAHLAVTSPTKSVTICHKGGFFCAPKIIPLPRAPSLEEARRNKPVDTSVASLFDTAYAHPALQRSPLLWFAYDQWIRKMHLLISGTEEGPDQWVGHMSKERKHVDAIFLVKSDRALPYISAGHRSESLWNKIRTAVLNVPIKDTGGRKIDVMSWPEEVDNEGFMTVNDEKGAARRIKPDVVVLATGYDTKFPFLDNSFPTLADTDVRCIYKHDRVDVGFIGFVRPSIGAIPPLAEMQAQFWVLRLLQHHYSEQVPRGPGRNALQPYEMD
jgi:dimethylaniline monooxygenase (N-oxide forming)